MLRIIFLLALSFPSLAIADYVELRRNANLYPEPDSSSVPITKLEFDAETDQYFDLKEETLTKGYFHIEVPDFGEGYIYRTLARSRDGERDLK